MGNINFINENEASLLKIRTYPDPVLSLVANPVIDFTNKNLPQIINNMLLTMYSAPGIGLAAPQVGISERFFVLDIDYERTVNDEIVKIENKNPFLFINPEIISHEETTCYQEGCLSVPEVYEEVNRYKKITLQYQDINGNKHTLEADGLMSICIQHELDHLNGIVFIDRLGNVKKNLIKTKFLKKKKNRK